MGGVANRQGPRCRRNGAPPVSVLYPSEVYCNWAFGVLLHLRLPRQLAAFRFSSI